MSDMDYFDQLELYEDLEDEFKNLPKIKNTPPVRKPARLKGRPNPHIKPGAEAKEVADLEEQVDELRDYEFTYQASRHERQWIIDSLGGFFEQQWFDDVLRLVKGGKEASVYLCTADPSTSAKYIAAKVYRPRRFRNLKNDHLYREGRDRLDGNGNLILDGGMNHAMDKRTAYGLELMHTSWIEHEYQTMLILETAGADIPQPYGRGNNAILMEYIGSPEMPAPTLNSVKLDMGEAVELYKRVLWNIDLMLSKDRIHGDLSAFNLLYWEGQLTLIDFPQAIEPRRNRNAYSIFERDVLRVCEYFSRQGVRVKPRRLAAEMWTAHGHRLDPEVHPRLLDDQDEADLAYWRSLQDSKKR